MSVFAAAVVALVLTATQPWEQRAVFEPSVTYDSRRDLYRMWYSGGWDSCAMGYAESHDGVRWDKASGPILGNGVGGVKMACRNTIVLADQYYLYFTDGDDHTRVATSPDGYSWTVRRDPVITTPLWASAGSTGVANTFVWNDGETWKMVYDVNMLDHWETGYATGESPYSFTDQGPVKGISLGATSGAPWVVKDDNGYTMYYLSAAPGRLNLPTNIYESHSTNLSHWTTPQLVLEPDGSWWQVDQVADPSIANNLMYFDGVDNANAVAAIGMAVRP